MAVEEMDEKTLIKRLMAGESEALEQIFNLHYTSLVRYGIRYVSLPEVSEEIVQELLINLWERRESLNIKTSLAAYLHTAVRYRAINYLKNQLPKDQNSSDLEVVEDYSEEDQAQMSPEMESQIQKAIDSLPPKCRAIFILSRMDGLSHKEIAKELGINEKTIENQMTIAFRKLRTILLPLRNNTLTIPVMLLLSELI